MSQQSKIVELSSIIASRTAEIDSYLQSKNIPVPSFEVDAARALPLPPPLMKARGEVLTATLELQALMEGPLAYGTRVIRSSKIHVALQALQRYKVPSLLAVDEVISYSELAQRCDMDESDLRRLMRMAISHYIFLEPQKGFVGHSAISRLFVEVSAVRHFVDMNVEEMWPVGTRVVDAMQKWPRSQEPGNSAYNLWYGTGESYWDVLDRDAEKTKRFSDVMVFFQSAPPFGIEHLFNSLKWDGVHNQQNDTKERPHSEQVSTSHDQISDNKVPSERQRRNITSTTCPKVMVDIGGSHGSVAISLLRKYSALEKVIVQDLPEVIGTASVPTDLEGRLEFQVHDYNKEQSVKRADVYFLRLILHSWSDKYAAKIIQNLIPALKHGARVIVNEICMPEPGQLAKYHEQSLRSSDLSMKQNFNSQERDADEWVVLFKSCDERFNSNGVKTSPSSMLAVMEFVWDNQSGCTSPNRS